MLRQLPPSEWVANGTEVPLCRLPLSVAQCERQFGLTFTASQAGQGEGPGPQHAVVELAGHVCLLQETRDERWPHPLLDVLARGDTREPAPLIDALCATFGLARAALPWVSPDLGPRQWALWRLDDNNNRSVMWYFNDLALAQRLANHYTARGHKQLYYVEEAL